MVLKRILCLPCHAMTVCRLMSRVTTLLLQRNSTTFQWHFKSNNCIFSGTFHWLQYQYNTTPVYDYCINKLSTCLTVLPVATLLWHMTVTVAFKVWQKFSIVSQLNSSSFPGLWGLLNDFKDLSHLQVLSRSWNYQSNSSTFKDVWQVWMRDRHSVVNYCMHISQHCLITIYAYLSASAQPLFFHGVRPTYPNSIPYFLDNCNSFPSSKR